MHWAECSYPVYKLNSVQLRIHAPEISGLAGYHMISRADILDSYMISAHLHMLSLAQSMNYVHNSYKHTRTVKQNIQARIASAVEAMTATTERR